MNKIIFLLFLAVPFVSYGQNYEQLLQQAQQEKNWNNYLQIAINYTDNLLNTQQNNLAAQQAETCLSVLSQNQPKPSVELAKLNKNAAIAFYSLENDPKVLFFLQKTLAINENLSPNAPELARDYANIGQMQTKLQQAKTAIKTLKKAEELLKPKPDKELMAYIYSQLCLAYAEADNFNDAISTANLAVSSSEEAYGNKSLDYAIALLNKGAVLQKMDMPEEAINSLQKAKKIFLGLQPSDYTNYHIANEQIGTTFQKLFLNDYKKTNFLDSALVYFNVNLMYDKSYLPESSPIIFNAFLATAQTYLTKDGYLFKTDNSDRIKISLKAAEAELTKLNLPAKSTIKAEFYKFLGIYQLYNLAPSEALAPFQAQIISLIDGFEDNNIDILPQEANFANCIALYQLTGALGWKARAHYELYLQNKNPRQLELAYQTVLVGDKLVNYIRKNAVGAKSYLSAASVDNYEFAIAICLELFANSKEEKYKHQAFYFAEKSKALGLLEAFQNSKAQQFAGIPPALIEKETELKLAISDLEQELFALLPKKTKDLLPQINALQTQIGEKKANYEQFLQQLEKEQPQYYQIKHELKLLNVEDTRKNLAEDQAIIEYFMGTEAVYIFKISKKEFEIKSWVIKGNNLRKQIADFREYIYGYYLGSVEQSESSYANMSSRYAELSHQLYQNLIAPISPLPKRLVIIPDGALAYLPFDALLTSPAADGKQFKTHNYLLLQHAISYSYSATLLQEMQTKTFDKKRSNLLAFAPSFGKEESAEVRGKRYDLSPLTFNVPEVQEIAKILNGGDLYINKEAKEETFKQLAGNYRIIHFATHGMANNDHPDYSLLAFAEIADDKENEYLYINDLYNMKLNADLVVLSACETGIGKLSRGEGVQSLARGFSYAGAKSIFTTLWSVNDLATSKIVAQFYKYLAQGKTKDEALQLAKIDYIKAANNNSANPFLWAPFILIGDTNAMPDIVASSIGLYLIIAATGLALLAILWWAKRKMAKIER